VVSETSIRPRAVLLIANAANPYSRGLRVARFGPLERLAPGPDAARERVARAAVEPSSASERIAAMLAESAP
jgi:hypothetical protein